MPSSVMAPCIHAAVPVVCRRRCARMDEAVGSDPVCDGIVCRGLWGLTLLQ